MHRLTFVLGLSTGKIMRVLFMNNRQCGIVCVGDFFVYVIKV